ncbi:MAG: hypothetical protein IRZ14_02840 [Chloroflexi bacterium]|nr:hypothetical protein [Chloroflexota bacterium]
MNFKDVEHERWGSFYLARLQHLCQLEARRTAPPAALPDPQRLIHKAIFATYCACVQYGRKDAADRLLALRPPSRPGVEARPA